MTIKVEKPDLYTLLKKRRKSLRQFLAENNVRTKKQLKTLCENLESEYRFSNKFYEEAEKCFSQELNKINKEEQSLAVVAVVAVVDEITNTEEETVENKRPATVRKTKRKERRPTKTSTVTKVNKEKPSKEKSEK